MDRRLGAAHRDELLLIHRRDLRRIEVTEPGVQRRRAGERPLHRYLLIEQHADQQCSAVGVEQSIGVGVAGDVHGSGHEGVLLGTKKSLGDGFAMLGCRGCSLY